jgi:hypothetical protein
VFIYIDFFDVLVFLCSSYQTYFEEVPAVARARRRGRGRLSAATPISRAEKVKVTIKAGPASTCTTQLYKWRLYR